MHSPAGPAALGGATNPSQSDSESSGIFRSGRQAPLSLQTARAGLKRSAGRAPAGASSCGSLCTSGASRHSESLGRRFRVFRGAAGSWDLQIGRSVAGQAPHEDRSRRVSRRVSVAPSRCHGERHSLLQKAQPRRLGSE